MLRKLIFFAALATSIVANALPAQADSSLLYDIRSDVRKTRSTLSELRQLQRELNSVFPDSRTSDNSLSKAKRAYLKFYSQSTNRQKAVVGILLPTLTDDANANATELYKTFGNGMSQPQWMAIFYNLKHILGQVRNNSNNLDGFLAYAYCINSGNICE